MAMTPPSKRRTAIGKLFVGKTTVPEEEETLTIFIYLATAGPAPTMTAPPAAAASSAPYKDSPVPVTNSPLDVDALLQAGESPIEYQSSFVADSSRIVAVVRQPFFGFSSMRSKVTNAAQLRTEPFLLETDQE